MVTRPDPRFCWRSSTARNATNWDKVRQTFESSVLRVCAPPGIPLQRMGAECMPYQAMFSPGRVRFLARPRSQLHLLRRGRVYEPPIGKDGNAPPRRALRFPVPAGSDSIDVGMGTPQLSFAAHLGGITSALKEISDGDRLLRYRRYRSYERYDEPETLPCSSRPFCPMS